MTRIRGLAVFVVVLLAGAAPTRAQSPNVVLVTLDGVRHQELFDGAERALIEGGESAGIEDPAPVLSRYWRDTPEARRETLMPFFWRELVPRGVLVKSRIRNPHRNSYPGYAELLTGRVVDEITGNVPVQNPAETILEIARRELALPRMGVAAITSWGHFPYIVESRPGTIFVNAGYQDVPAAVANREMERWSGLQHLVPAPWDSVRFNAVTLGLAEEYLRLYRPRLLFVALDETDEWAHARRYDKTLLALEHADAGLRSLWETLESMVHYRGRTTMVVATDHGRGTTLRDWTDHGADIESARDTWIAVVGPDTPARGLVEGTVENGQVAATVLALLGIEPETLGPGASAPLRPALRR